MPLTDDLLKGIACIRLVVGLGNPGLQYAKTRHNVGVWFVEALAQHYGKSLRLDTKHKGLVTQINEDERCIRLFVPQSYMNVCGLTIKRLVDFYKIPLSSLLVAHDELDFLPGVVKFKQGGGHAGHNGVRDIIRHLGSADFCRLRFGIGHPGCRDKVSDYVLSQPPLDDKLTIAQAIDEALVRVRRLL